MDEELMTSGEAAQYLGITRQRVAQLTTGGQLTAKRVGRFSLYRREDLDRWRAMPKDKGGRPKSRGLLVKRISSPY